MEIKPRTSIDYLIKAGEARPVGESLPPLTPLSARWKPVVIKIQLSIDLTSIPELVLSPSSRRNGSRVGDTGVWWSEKRAQTPTVSVLALFL